MNPVYTEQSTKPNNMYLSEQKSNNPNFVSKLGLLGGGAGGIRTHGGGKPSTDFEFFENLGKHRKSVSFSRKITEAKKRGSARLSSAPYTPKTAQTQEIHRLEIGSKVLSKFSPGGQKSGTLERTQERTHPTNGIRDSSCR